MYYKISLEDRLLLLALARSVDLNLQEGGDTGEADAMALSGLLCELLESSMIEIKPCESE